MQTPQKNAPQSARRSSKQPQPQPQQHQGPKSEVHKSVQSDNDAYLVSGQEGDQTPSRKNRKPRKKSNARKNGVQSDVGEMIEIHTHATARTKHTPAKAIKSDAYAGPTFHQSPAASALPMPSFLSRSVPNSNPLVTVAAAADGTLDNSQAVNQDVAKELEDKRESTPLDWMFDAARQSKTTPNGINSTGRVQTPNSQSPAPRREDSEFPFAFDVPEESGSVYSTPLTHRLAASKSPQPVSADIRPMTEEQRRAKSDALKKALMNSPPPTELGPAFNENNPFNARSVQHASNPATPTYSTGYGQPQNNYFQYGQQWNNNHQQPQRPPSSGLRNVYDPGFRAPLSPPNTGQDSRISTTRSPQAQPARALNFGAIYGGSASRPQSEGNPIGHNSKPSLEQGLDDLKKALNMNFMGQA